MALHIFLATDFDGNVMTLFQRLAAAAALAGCAVPAQAGNWAPRQEAIWSFASGYAFLTQCAVRGYARMEPVAELGGLYRQLLTEKAYEDWRRVYQRAVHEKRIYSISRDSWIPWTVNDEDCKDSDRAAELMIMRLKASGSAPPPS